MKKRLATMVMAMVTAVCMCGAMRVEAAEITPDKFVREDDPQRQPIAVIQTIHTQMYEAYDGEEIVTAYYVVTQDNETIESIARRLQVTEEYLLTVNPDCKLDVDESFPKFAYVEIPEMYWGEMKNVYYIVSSGDCLNTISNYFHTDMEELMEMNPDIKNANLIYVGDAIRVK